MSDTRREDKRIVLIIAWGCWSSAHLPRYCDPYCFNLQSTLPLFFTEHCNGILPPIQSSMSIFVMLWIYCRSAPLLSLALSTKVSHQSTLPLNVIRLPFRWAILLINLCMSSCQTKRPRGQKKRLVYSSSVATGVGAARIQMSVATISNVLTSVATIDNLAVATNTRVATIEPGNIVGTTQMLCCNVPMYVCVRIVW